MRASRRLGLLAACFTSAIILFLSSFATAGQVSHKIKQGDTLWDLAKKYKTSPKAIAKANGISENATLGLGKSVRIPTEYAAAKRYVRSAKKYAAKCAAGVLGSVHTSADGVCLRAGASTNHRRIAVLPAGSTAKLLATTGSWAKVALGDGTCGFIYRPLLKHGAGTVTYSSESPVPTVGSGSPDSSGEADLVQMALACRGDRYRRGGTSRGGFDCSGFTRYVFAKYGVKLPHSSAAQAGKGTSVSKSELASGDLVFFHTYRRGISHVGIYIENGQFVHAATYGRGVRVDSINSGYYASRYVCARRVK